MRGQSGLTLIELMMVMVGIVMVSGGSLAAYLRFNNNQQNTNDTRRTVTEIERARSAASSLQYPGGCQQMRGTNLSSSMVDGELTGVVMTTLCDSGNIVESATKVLQSSTFDGAFSVTFLSGSGYIDSGDDVAITVRSSYNNQVAKIITISTYGGLSTENAPVQ